MGGIASALGSLFGGSKPKTPKVQAPAPMPLPDDPAIQMARRRRIAQLQQRTGRQSTMLSDAAATGSVGSDKLG